MTVNGNGHITARPNQAKLTLGVVTEHTSAQTAQQENAEISNRVIEALKQIGIDESDIKTTVYSVQPRYDYHDGNSILRGYEVEHHFEVTIKDLSKIGNVYDFANLTKSRSFCSEDKSNRHHFIEHTGVYSEPAYSGSVCRVDDGDWFRPENTWIRFCI